MARKVTGFSSKGGRLSSGKARFSADVDAWVLETEKRINAVIRESTQRVISTMQENVPYQHGFLRASLVIAVNTELPKADRTEEDGLGPYTESYLQMQIGNLNGGDKIIAGYTMVYARRLEYGFTGTDSLGRSYNQAPRGWVRAAAQQWKGIVQQVTMEAKARSPRGKR
jgi:hypothetical protein